MRVVNARELAELIRTLVFRLMISINELLIPMLALSAEDSGTFSVATWNIRSGRGAGLAAAAKGLHQMGVGCAVLTETKLNDDRYPKFVQGYHVTGGSGSAMERFGGIGIFSGGGDRRLPECPDLSTGHGGSSILRHGGLHPSR